MATSNTGIHDDYFVSELKRAKKKVQDKFEELRKHINDRERILIQELDDITSLHTSYEEGFEQISEDTKMAEYLIDVTKNVNFNLQNMLLLQDTIITQLNEQLRLMKIPVKPKLVTFVCEPDNLLTELHKFGQLVKVKDSIDYSKKTQPIISACCKGKQDEELYNPYGVAVDPNSGNIYVTDQSLDCVKVFDSSAKYLTKFGHADGEGKMNSPRCLAIGGNRLFITQGSSCILAYQLDGKFIHKTGSFGDGDLQFKHPWGLTINEDNRDLYICDLCNNRVQILSENFQYESQFGKDILYKPRQTKLTKENVFVLDESSPCLRIFGKDLMIQRDVITRGEEQQVTDPHYFFIDKYGYILVSDCGSNSILIFNSELEFLHRISVGNSPMEITMDAKDRIIVVCKATDSCIHLF